jgi:hypothetical protein
VARGYSGSTVGEALKKKVSKEVDACDWVLVEFVASQPKEKKALSPSCTVAALANLRFAYASSDVIQVLRPPSLFLIELSF